MKLGKIAAIAVGVTFAATAITGCSAADSSSNSDATTVNWWTWDPSQADAYGQCVQDFEAANPGTTVKISQYNVGDYFTKLTTGFVAEDAPDAFMISTTFLQSYASQGQLLPLDDKIKSTNYDMSQFAQGVDLWQYTDGQQYGIPMDWAAAALFFNTDLVTAAGYTADDIKNLTWDPATGGTFLATVKHLTIDQNGVRGDEAGFDKTKVKTYGIGTLEGNESFGDSNWGPLVASTGTQIANKANWPTQFNYADPNVVKAMTFAKTLSEDGFAPKAKQFTTGGSDQLGTESVAMIADGSWTASTYSKLPGATIGTAPVAKAADGTRGLASNVNGNVVWAGTKNVDKTWAWVSYQESEACQTKAALYNASFFPSNAASMQALVEHSATAGLDLSVFGDYQKDDVLFPIPAYNNGTEMDATVRPMISGFFAGDSGDEIFAKMQAASADIIGGSN
jgi:ABC-type glycerol-3-phosphate transport system substrate-binding protein